MPRTYILWSSVPGSSGVHSSVSSALAVPGAVTVAKRPITLKWSSAWPLLEEVAAPVEAVLHDETGDAVDRLHLVGDGEHVAGRLAVLDAGEDVAGAWPERIPRVVDAGAEGGGGR